MSTRVALPMPNRPILMMSDRQQSLPLIPLTTAATTVPQQTEFPLRATVRRKLFGPSDREQNCNLVNKELSKIFAADNAKYNFDFASEKPLNSTSGRYVWERVEPATVPSAYSSIGLRAQTRSQSSSSNTSDVTTTTTSNTNTIVHDTQQPPIIATTLSTSTTTLSHPVAIRPNNVTTTPSTTTNNHSCESITSTTPESKPSTTTTSSGESSTSDVSTSNHVTSSTQKLSKNSENKESQIRITEFVQMSRRRPASKEESGPSNKRQKTS